MAPLRRLRKAKPRPSPPPPRNELEAMLPLYLEWLEVRQYSGETIRTRRNHLEVFLRWCGERGLEDPHEITRPVLERYQRHLFHYRKRNGQLLGFRTQHAMLVPLRSWFKWMTRQNHILHNPASEMELPRRSHTLPKHVLTAEEVEQVLLQPDMRDPMGLRDRAILETLYSTGVRRGELVQIKLYDADLKNGTVFIRQGKGKKDRVVPIGDRAIAWIEKYLRETRPQLAMEPDDMTLFLSQYGEPISRDHLSDKVHDYIEAANLGKSGGPHLLRHTMATLMLEGGADVRFIQQMLGHSNLSSTEIYTHVSIRQLKQVHQATHPAQLKKPETTALRQDAEQRAELLAALADEEAEGEENE
ncbi:MAG TPA: site-specific tyrosine recombinase XerC [Terriglobales bacterium]|nr:site-specific tyrosine recombinase XerC [Terriglobales bacterium]